MSRLFRTSGCSEGIDAAGEHWVVEDGAALIALQSFPRAFSPPRSRTASGSLTVEFSFLSRRPRACAVPEALVCLSLGASLAGCEEASGSHSAKKEQIMAGSPIVCFSYTTISVVAHIQ